MTITVTAHPEATPPLNTVTVSVTTGNVMSAVAVYRNDHNGRSLLRTQPTAGFDSRTVTDYECPYEENVTYDWTATYSDPASAVTVFNETWASTASWTADYGAWNVSAGKARNTTTTAILTRSFTLGKYRYSFASWAAATGTFNAIYIYTGVLTNGIILRISGTVMSIGTSAGVTTTTIDATQPFVVDFNASSVSISGTGGTATVAGDYSASKISLYSIAPANAFQLGAVSLKSYAASSNIAQTSSAVNLEPSSAWMIHPGTSDLSFPLSATDSSAASIVDIDPVENVSNATVHKILGSATPIPTTTGPRSDDKTTMTVATLTSAESAALRALLAPDVPILFQVPPSWGLDFNSGFYQVGDTAFGRRDELDRARRTVTLPLQKVQSPVVDVENTGWSYASVAAEFGTYSDITTTFATYADLAANTRA